MTKAKKSLFKFLKKYKHRAGFIKMLTAQQDRLGRYKHWDQACRQRLAKRDIAAKGVL